MCFELILESVPIVFFYSRIYKVLYVMYLLCNFNYERCKIIILYKFTLQSSSFHDFFIRKNYKSLHTWVKILVDGAA